MCVCRARLVYTLINKRLPSKIEVYRTRTPTPTVRTGHIVGGGQLRGGRHDDDAAVRPGARGGHAGPVVANGGVVQLADEVFGGIATRVAARRLLLLASHGFVFDGRVAARAAVGGLDGVGLGPRVAALDGFGRPGAPPLYARLTAHAGIRWRPSRPLDEGETLTQHVRIARGHDRRRQLHPRAPVGHFGDSLRSVPRLASLRP